MMKTALQMQLETLTLGLVEAGAANDWPALARADAETAATLTRFAATRPQSAAEIGTLATLRAAHGQALARCRVESARAGERLDDLRRHRDGWMAYALMVSLLDGAAA